MATSTITAETNVRTLTFSVSGVRPVKASFEYFDVTGARIIYTDHEVTELRILTTDQEAEPVDISVRLDCRDMWEPWLRDLVEQHRPTA